MDMQNLKEPILQTLQLQLQGQSGVEIFLMTGIWDLNICGRKSVVFRAAGLRDSLGVQILSQHFSTSLPTKVKTLFSTWIQVWWGVTHSDKS